MATISEDLQVTNYKEIVLPEDNYFQEVLLFNGTLYVFSRTSNKDMSASTLSVSTLNKASLELKNDMKALFEIKANTSDENNNLFFTFRTSPDVYPVPKQLPHCFCEGERGFCETFLVSV